jgi:selenide, water dikinase
MSTLWAPSRSWRSPFWGFRSIKSRPKRCAKYLRAARPFALRPAFPVAGGHSIDSPEPIYGLAVIGICKTEDVRRKSDAKSDDAIILTKPLGVGVYSAALKKGTLSHAGYAEMIATTTLLNRVGAELAKDPAIHAITDVTGFGLLGYALEVARNSGLTIVIQASDVPLMSEATRLAQQGHVTGASIRNWASYGNDVRLAVGLPEWQRHLLTDPQTSGGLLVSCERDHADVVV